MKRAPLKWLPAAALLLAGAAACARSHESRVKSIEARIDGLTCPTCVPPLRNSLKRHYAGSEIDVDDDKDTATIRFAGAETFSPAEFQAAVEHVRMRVVTVRMQACGTVEAADGRQWLVAGTNRFVLRGDRDLPLKVPICADGSLDTRASPATFQVSAFSRQGSR
jgi:hypothetical protein